LQYFIDNNIKVCFTQGLDIRLITEEKAEMLSRVKYYDKNFVKRRLYFALDNPSDRKIFCDKLKILLNYIKPYRVMVYILVGFNTTFEQDMDRFNTVRDFGCDPYIMIYGNRKYKPKIRNFARWVNKRIYKSCSFKEYKG